MLKILLILGLFCNAASGCIAGSKAIDRTELLVDSMNISSITGDRVRGAPYYNDGKIIGFQLDSSRLPERLKAVGLMPSDIITSINDIPLTSKNNGVRALRNGVSTKNLDLVILRKGTNIFLFLKLVEKNIARD